jgi:NADH-quinone oxidoreductase subunit G
MDLHYVLDRPHLNEGARVLRVKPRYNPEVNQWWLCDEGRYGFGWIDRGRLKKVRGPSSNGKGATWEQAFGVIGGALAKLKQEQSGARIGVIVSAQLTNEELFLIREVFETALGGQVSANVPERPGTSDEFLIEADKNPNSLGAALLSFYGADALDAGEILDRGLQGELDLLWVFGHDLMELFPGKNVRELPNKVSLFVYSGTNENATAALAHWVLPTAAYVERDGTFVNCDGRVQRIGLAFPPLADSREDWRILLELAKQLGIGGAWSGPESIFRALAQELEVFAGLSYEAIGMQGASLAIAKREASAGV